MATKGDTFERKEKKYLISAEQCAAIKAGLAAHMRLDDYGATRIDSLYLDTEAHDLINRSLEKPQLRCLLPGRHRFPRDQEEVQGHRLQAARAHEPGRLPGVSRRHVL